MKEDTEIDIAAYRAAIKEVHKIEEEHGIIRETKTVDTAPIQNDTTE